MVTTHGRAGPSDGVVEATLGGLLHDIGKIGIPAQPGNDQPAHWECETPHLVWGACGCSQRLRHRHAALGANLIAALLGHDAPATALTAHHHGQADGPPARSYVQRGDHLSAGGPDEPTDGSDGPEDGVPLLLAPLASSNTPLRLSPRTLGEPWPPVQSLSQAPPRLSAAYEALVQQFREAAPHVRPLAGDALVDAVLGLVENVASLVPAPPLTGSSAVSLAAHLHHAGAFAGALAAAGSPTADPVATLVMGDISGIQAFLHRAASARASRQLRARSFYLSLLPWVVARTVARRLGLTPANVLMATGGNFSVLAPAGVDAQLHGIAAEINNALQEVHGPGLGAVFAWTALTEADTRAFAQVVDRVRRELAVAKVRRLDATLDPRLFAPASAGGASQACGACGGDQARDRGDGEYLCDTCHGLVELGRRLPRAAFLTLEATGPTDTDIRGIGDWRRFFARLGWHLDVWEDGLPPAAPHRSLIALDAAALARAPHARLTVAGKHVPTHAREGPATTVDFEEIAQRGPGRKLLACAKLDVDDLGTFFAGLARDQRNSPARVASASRFLSLFFEGYVDHLAKERPKQDIYLVYSGGDDAVVIGQWWAVLGMVTDLRAQFDQWTGGNPDLHFSAGIAFGSESRPVILALQEAEELLALAKDQPGKDRCTVFRIPFRWQDLTGILAWSHRLAGPIERDTWPRGLLQTLLQAEPAIDRQHPLGAPRYGPALWRVPHHLGRAAERHRGTGLDELAADVAQELLAPGGAARLWAAARLAEWYTRSSREAGSSS